MKKDLTCEERIDKKLRGRILEIEEVIKLYECSNDGHFIYDDCEYEDLIDWLNQRALSYEDDSHYRAKRLELSTGGPADGFLFFEDGTIEYYFQDWFDGAKRELYGRDKEIMQKLYDYCLNVE